MKSGKVEPKVFNVKIPFEYKLGLVILKVSISGEEYDFVLDTGAPNVLSEKLTQKLGLSTIVEQKVGDSQGESSTLGFTTIEKLSIGGIHFLNTGAAIADLDKSKEVACLEIDGFIGSNLMKQAIWKIDFENQMVTITNVLESLDIKETTNKIPFYTEITGVPIIDVKLNNVVEKNVTVDLGSNGDISLSQKTYDKLLKKNPSVPKTYSYGYSSSGLYGLGQRDTTFYVKVPKVSFGDILLKNTIVNFSGSSASTIGTNFFKSSDLIFNWNNKEIILVKKQEYNNSTFTSFGFSYANQENQLIVSEVHKNINSLKVGDILIGIGTDTFEELSDNQWCEILLNGFINKEAQEINIIVLRDGEKLNYILKKRNFL